MLRVTSVWTGKPGTPWYSTLFFEGNLSTEAQAAVDQVDEMLESLTGFQSAGLSAQVDPFVAVVNPASGDVTGGFVTTPDAPHASLGTGQMLPGASQALVQLRTGRYEGGREIRGKFYVPGLLAGYSTETGQTSASFRGNLNTVMAAVLADGPDLQVWSRKNGAAYQVTSATTAVEWAVLRSRRD